ncbi:MAG: hypothetical protein RLZZ74_1562 [Cyanobacteriota bacterium]|jgi:hypothetical protein
MGLDFITILSNSIGSVVGGAASKTYNGISALSSGTNSSFNKNYFNNLTIDIVTQGIDGQRIKISNKIKSDDINNISLIDAIQNAYMYDNACSLISGLEYAKSVITSTSPKNNSSSNQDNSENSTDKDTSLKTTNQPILYSYDKNNKITPNDLNNKKSTPNKNKNTYEFQFPDIAPLR